MKTYIHREMGTVGHVTWTLKELSQTWPTPPENVAYREGDHASSRR